MAWMSTEHVFFFLFFFFFVGGGGGGGGDKKKMDISYKYFLAPDKYIQPDK